MEPLPEGSGRWAIIVRGYTIRQLQWSRFPKEAEGGKTDPKLRQPHPLQWSRFPKEAEGQHLQPLRLQIEQLQWSRFPKEAEGLSTRREYPIVF